MTRNLIKKTFFIGTGVWLVISVTMAAFSEQFIFWETPHYPLAENAQQLFFDRAFGTHKIRGELVDARWIGHPYSDKVVLYLSGSGGRVPTIMTALAEKHAVLAPCYPGYEKSAGKASTKTVYETARASIEYLLKHNYQPEDIIVWGHSLGGSPAVYLSTLYPNLHRVILVNTFDSIQKMGYRRYGPFAAFGGGIFDSVALAAQGAGNFRQFHVENDDEVPMAAALNLFAALKGKDKTFSTLDGTHSEPDVAATLADT